ncbi:MAG TPA: YifB family Mg chelatase-like AAA ATPase [Atribacteraceae bacterium]|nr:YifB family Mg chelatase-like AAA ATPase [Atribacteraceae bacterium]
MLARVMGVTTIGIDARLVEVEVDVGTGLPAFNIVGLPDTAVQEARERVRSAIKNSGFTFPARKITVNLAPASLKKSGSDFDLPIACGILSATEQISISPGKRVFMGELSLSGEIKPVKGVLPVAHTLGKERDGHALFVSRDNAREGAVAGGVDVYGFGTLVELCDVLEGKRAVEPVQVEVARWFTRVGEDEEDLREVKGQRHGKRALEIAAAGGHHLLFIGAPGSGKTMLARRLPSILPLLSLEEAIEVTKIHSVGGYLHDDRPLVTVRPVRSPHHTISDVALIGGGQWPRPGEISLAHHGVLFLDEVLEFRRNVLEALREPLEEGRITISRANSQATYPARFMLVLSCNPCPCGYLGDSKRPCTCSFPAVARYRGKLSGPLLDRIDLQVEIPRLEYSEIASENQEESSETVRKRVERARAIQNSRLRERSIRVNGDMKARHVKTHCRCDDKAKKFLERAMENLAMSARGYHRVLKVARTIADLAEMELIGIDQVAEAVQYRTLDRKLLDG